MEIKTITAPRCDGTSWFDKKVNEALTEGFQLVRRDMLPGGTFGGTTYQPAYYAELVKSDEPEPEDDETKVIKALRTAQEFCRGMACEGCTLENFCRQHLANNEGPCDWEYIPEAPKSRPEKPSEPDKPLEQERMTRLGVIINGLQATKELCAKNKENCSNCPIATFCAQHLPNYDSPEEWGDISEEIEGAPKE